MDKGILVVISGFSGAGKGTVIKKILSENDLGSREFYHRISAMLAEEVKLLSADSELTEKRYERFRSLGVSAVIKE